MVVIQSIYYKENGLTIASILKCSKFYSINAIFRYILNHLLLITIIHFTTIYLNENFFSRNLFIWESHLSLSLFAFTFWNFVFNYDLFFIKHKNLLKTSFFIVEI